MLNKKKNNNFTSVQSIGFAVMEAKKKKDEIYNVVADQNYLEGVTKHQKDGLRNNTGKGWGNVCR